MADQLSFRQLVGLFPVYLAGLLAVMTAMHERLVRKTRD